MSLTNRPSAASVATGAGTTALLPLLRTAKRVKRTLTPVQPSQAFQASLGGELLRVARRLAMSRGNAPRALIDDVGFAGIRREQAAVILGGLAVASTLLALLLLMSRAGRARRRE
jgi:hypothetical protein